MIGDLQEEFGIQGSIAIEAGMNGLPKVVMTHNSGSRAEVYLHGGHLTSWTTAEGEELLFISRESEFKSGSPIRGGVPICFPQFASQGKLPKHGFARTSEWELIRTGIYNSDTVSASLRFTDSKETLAIWPHEFILCVKFMLKANSLVIKSTLENIGDRDVKFEMAFHTYFRLGSIDQASVEGLEGITYIDAANQNARGVENRNVIPIQGEIDRVYESAPDLVILHDMARGRSIRVGKHNFPDAVVWNPGELVARGIPDLGDDEYLRFVCIETGCMASPMELAAGSAWDGETVLTCL